jgi:acyl-coenzyme A thioesterase PaaI-like protein
MLQVSSSELNQLLDRHDFTRRMGLRVVSLGDGECELAVPYLPELDRPGGIVSGQVFMHAADVAFWLAIKTRLGLDDASVTSSMTTAFLGSASREALRCHAWVLKLGRRLIYGCAECMADDRPVTHHTLTYARMANTGGS